MRTYVNYRGFVMAKFRKISEARKKRKASWLLSKMIPNGSVSLVSGDPGTNKSFLLACMAAKVTRGESMPFSPVPEKAGGVIILNSEDPDAEIEERVLAAGGDIDRLFVVEKGTISLPGDIQELREFVRANDIRLIIVDPLESFMEGAISSRTAIRRVFDPLNRMAEELDIAIVAVRHLTKSTSTTAAEPWCWKWCVNGCRAIRTARGGLADQSGASGDSSIEV